MQDGFFSLFLFFFPCHWEEENKSLYYSTGRHRGDKLQLPPSAHGGVLFSHLISSSRSHHLGAQCWPGGAQSAAVPIPAPGRGPRAGCGPERCAEPRGSRREPSAQPSADAAGTDARAWTTNPAWLEHPQKDSTSTKKPIFTISSGTVAFSANYCVV